MQLLHATVPTLLLFATLAVAQGPAAKLADINPVLSATNPGGAGNQFLTIGAITYFTGNDGVTGQALWRTDGTAAGTRLIRQFCTQGNPGIASMAALNGVLYFRGTDDINTTNTELWRSDGTAAGTYRLKEINPGPDGSSPAGMLAFDGKLWFSADDGVHGRELWTSDGTEAGTVLVRDIHPTGDGLTTSPAMIGLPGSSPVLMFAADDGTHGVELWRSSGTQGGTMLHDDIEPGTGSSSPSGFELVGSAVYFAATLSGSGRELHVASLLGSSLVADIRPGTAASNPSSLTELNGSLYFSANDGTNGAELWRYTSGASPSLGMVSDINPGSAGSSPSIVRVGNLLALVATTAANGRELWRSNGLVRGTVLVADIRAGTASSFMTGITALGSTIVFTADDGVVGEEVWRSDLTAAGTFLARDIRPGSATSNPFVMTAVSGAYALLVANDGVHGQEIWRCDGTVAGTFLLADISPRTSSSSPGSFLDSEGLQGVYFAAEDGVRGRELWQSDGTPSGTQLVRDVQPGAGSSAPALLGMAGSIALFSADDGVRGRELWRTDGTTAGTFLLADINPGAAGSEAGFAVVQGPTFAAAALDGIVYFPADDGVHGSELWRSDGTAAGTFRVTDIAAGATPSAPVSLFALGNTIYFSATEPSIGREVWKTDGTAAGTQLLRGDVNPGPADSCFVRHQFWAYGSRLVCPMRDPASGYELWMSDGTVAGTVQVKDINPGTGGSSPQDMVELGGILYFVAYEPTQGQELWRSDGSNAGTFLLRDIQPGAGQATPFSLTRVGSAIVFFANAGHATGWELWRTNGTAAGTVLVEDIHPGTGDSLTFDIDAIWAAPGANVAVFPASEGQGGVELWRTDGSAAGTVLHADLNPGPASSQPSRPVQAGSHLFFTADDGAGRELYSMLSMASAEAYGKGCPGTGGRVPTLSALGAPSLGNARFADVVGNGLAGSTAILFWGVAPARFDAGFGCRFWFDPFAPFVTVVVPTNAQGSATFPLPIPANLSLLGLQFFTQADVLDPRGAYAGVASSTGGLRHVLHTR